MSEKEKITDEVINEITADEEADDSLLIKFKKPYVFEGQTYQEVDLSGLENLTATAMIKVENRLKARSNVAVDLVPEMSIAYACEIAGEACDQPVEFFKGLPLKEAVKVKNKIVGFIFG